jgi:hypothetical protein
MQGLLIFRYLPFKNLSSISALGPGCVKTQKSRKRWSYHAKY